MSDITLDRLRIVRNSIVREWQKLRDVMVKLPKRETKERLIREMSGIKTGLFLLHHEFDELEPVDMDQKPICPFCGDEMEGLRELSDHMKDHNVRGIKWAAPGLPLDKAVGMRVDLRSIIEAFGGPGKMGAMLDGIQHGIPSTARGPGVPLHDDDVIGPIHLVDDSQPIEVMIEGIKYKKPAKEGLERASDLLESFIVMETDEGEGADEGLCDVVEYLRRIAKDQKEHDDRMRLEKPEDGIMAEEYAHALKMNIHDVITRGSSHIQTPEEREEYYRTRRAERQAGGSGEQLCVSGPHSSRNPETHLPPPANKTDVLLAEQREIYPGRTCACCWHYERIARDTDYRNKPENCRRFFVLPEEDGCADWKHYEEK
jgi:hypothetical protein